MFLITTGPAWFYCFTKEKQRQWPYEKDRVILSAVSLQPNNNMQIVVRLTLKHSYLIPPCELGARYNRGAAPPIKTCSRPLEEGV